MDRTGPPINKTYRVILIAIAVLSALAFFDSLFRFPGIDRSFSTFRSSSAPLGEPIASLPMPSPAVTKAFAIAGIGANAVCFLGAILVLRTRETGLLLTIGLALALALACMNSFYRGAILNRDLDHIMAFDQAPAEKSPREKLNVQKSFELVTTRKRRGALELIGDLTLYGILFWFLWRKKQAEKGSRSLL